MQRQAQHCRRTDDELSSNLHATTGACIFLVLWVAVVAGWCMCNFFRHKHSALPWGSAVYSAVSISWCGVKSLFLSWLQVMDDKPPDQGLGGQDLIDLGGWLLHASEPGAADVWPAAILHLCVHQYVVLEAVLFCFQLEGSCW